MIISENHLVTCLNTVGYVFGHFWKTEIFSIFFDFFQVSTLQCVIAIPFRKKYLKTSSELVWTLLGTVWDNLEILKFSIFSIFLLSNLQGALSNNFTEKISSKHVQNMFDCFWERFWAFWKCENFSSFLKLFQISTFLGALGIFFGESYLKTSSKLVWTLLGTFLDTSEISKLRFCFPFVPIFDPAGHDDFRKSPGNMFEHCWVRFWTFLRNWNIFNFFWIFSNLDPPVCTSHFFSKKIPQNKFRTSFDAIRNRFGHFSNIEIFHIFHLLFSRISRVHWATILSKNIPRIMFKTCLIAFGNVFGHFENVKVFPASRFCSKFWHSWVHWALFFQEIYLKTSSKHVWRLLGTFLDTFQISKVHFFFIFLHFSTLQGMMISKNHMVTCLNTVGYVFGHFWKTEMFSIFFWFFSSLDPPVCNSHSFSKKIPQNKFRTCLDAIRNRFGHFSNIEIFHIFHLLFSRTSRVHWATILSKKIPRIMFKTCLIAFGNVFGHFENVKVFPVSWFCSKFWHSWVHWALFFRESYLKTSSKHVWRLLGTFLDNFQISKVRFFFIFLHFSTLQGMMISKKITS